MSAIRLWYLYCDGGTECPRQDGEQSPFRVDPLPGQTPAWIRAQAAAEGWKNIRRIDYCPECVKRIEASTQRTGHKL